MFSKTLEETGKAQTLTYGGFKDTPQMIASFPGGQVYQLPEIVSDWEILGLNPNDTRGPALFQTSARYSWVNSFVAISQACVLHFLSQTEHQRSVFSDSRQRKHSDGIRF